MTLFSERHGYKPVKTVLQTDTMDADLRNGLWNVIYERCLKRSQTDIRLSEMAEHADPLLRALWVDYFKLPIDAITAHQSKAYADIREYFFKCQWHYVYDFLEFVVRNRPKGHVQDSVIRDLNVVLARECAAYRFVDTSITQITSEVEIAEIQHALDATRAQPLQPVNTHLDTALQMFSDRKSPDYRNSIKESISAVEALGKLITKSPSVTLPQALDKLEAQGMQLHAALKSALVKMYGYTSDASGIRHGLSDESSVDADDARFMLVTCSAFVNYLLSKAAQAGLQIPGT